MPLTNVQIQPGFNKQVTAAGAEGQWIDGDFVRFRYGLPEKIGGWEQLVSTTLAGAAREQFIWADLWYYPFRNCINKLHVWYGKYFCNCYCK